MRKEHEHTKGPGRDEKGRVYACLSACCKHLVSVAGSQHATKASLMKGDRDDMHVAETWPALLHGNSMQ